MTALRLTSQAIAALVFAYAFGGWMILTPETVAGWVL